MPLQRRYLWSIPVIDLFKNIIFLESLSSAKLQITEHERA